MTPTPTQPRRTMTVRSAKVRLPTGQVEVRVQGTAPGWHLEDLCDFAARDNAKRGFLVVSKVLGRHLPVRPSAMRRSFKALADQLPADMLGPVVFVGMAETAVCLGQGVHEEYVKRTGRTDCMYIHSTRQRPRTLKEPGHFEFTEPHSHAAAHIVYYPSEPEAAQRFWQCRNIVLVDDEITTGTTLQNLANVLRPNPKEQVDLHFVCLTDWSGGKMQLGSVPVYSLLRGTLKWHPCTAAHSKSRKYTAAYSGYGVLRSRKNYGRFGVARVVDDEDYEASSHNWLGETTLVLGSGEFVYPPFRIAEKLEKQGCDVWVQAVTRSPILTGGAVQETFRLPDEYESGAQCYLHNPLMCHPTYVMVCSETGNVQQCNFLNLATLYTQRFTHRKPRVVPVFMGDRK